MTVARSVIVLIFLSLSHTTSSSDDSVRSTTTGSIRGFRKNLLGTDIDVFLGILYAEPPISERRFHRPQPIKSWNATRDAVNFTPACYQEIDISFNMFDGVNMWNPNYGVSEDCLYLNVWQPSGGSSGKATLVWIYGGSFNSGTSSLDVYDGSYLAAKGDVVVVSINFRSGPFGFLHLSGGKDDDAAQGNMGLLDQSLAIQWYSQNADKFGGDKRRITLFGESSGAASVDYQLISPQTKNLFQSAIMQSAASLSPWAYDEPEVAQSKALELAGLVDCGVQLKNGKLTPQQRITLVECLQKVPVSKLSAKQFEVNDDEDIIFAAFVPTLDGYFLKESPQKSIESNARGSKPILAGVVKNEGVYFLAYLQQSLFPVIDTITPLNQSQYDQGVSGILKVDKKFVVDTVNFEYRSELQDSINYRDVLDDIQGDGSFKCPVLRVAQGQSNAGRDVYLYEYDHRTSVNTWPLWMGVMHGYEIDHVFGLPLNDSLRYRSDEKKLSEAVVKYWTNFAKSGNPNLGDNNVKNVDVEWPKYNLAYKNILSLNTSSIQVKSGLRDRACELWNNIIPELREGTCFYCVCSAATGVVECRAGLSTMFSHTTLNSLLICFILYIILINF